MAAGHPAIPATAGRERQVEIMAGRLETRLHREDILDEIKAERMEQDKQWGGPSHDDHHTTTDWMRYITYQAQQSVNPNEFRERMVKVAALAVAAIESYDRKHGAK